MELCENLVYDPIFDSCLKWLIKNTTNVHNIEKQASVSETLAEIEALVDVDAADAEAIEDADAPASTDSLANIQIIVRSTKGTEANNTPKWL